MPDATQGAQSFRREMITRFDKRRRKPPCNAQVRTSAALAANTWCRRPARRRPQILSPPISRRHTGIRRLSSSLANEMMPAASGRPGFSATHIYIDIFILFRRNGHRQQAAMPRIYYMTYTIRAARYYDDNILGFAGDSRLMPAAFTPSRAAKIPIQQRSFLWGWRARISLLSTP